MAGYLRVQEEIDFVVGNWHVCTHPGSPFLGKLVVAPGLRHILSGGGYAVHRLGAPGERRELHDPDAVMVLLREEFGICLPQRSDLRDAIAGVLDMGNARRSKK